MPGESTKYIKITRSHHQVILYTILYYYIKYNFIMLSILYSLVIYI